MANQLKQQPRLSQQLVMTQQLQQAIKLLQYSRQELAAELRQALDQNPMLEEAPPPEPPRELAAEEETYAEAPSETSPEGAAAAHEATPQEQAAELDWRDYLESHPQTGLSAAQAQSAAIALDERATRRATLQEHLRAQLQPAALSPEQQRATACILGNLDDDGYLRCGVDEVAQQADADLPAAQAALQRVQALDPAGVAARDLRECLLLQLQAGGARAKLPENADIPLMRALVETQLQNLQRRDMRAAARALRRRPREVAAAAAALTALEPRPARAYGGDEAVYVAPDVYVYALDGAFHIELNEDELPQLQLNRAYLGAFPQKRRLDSRAQREAREYMEEKARAAKWLIKSVHQRRRTVYKVMASIVRRQRAFFQSGVSALTPLSLREVAADIGMHESTVSRVTTNKYAQTPQGLFELKYFFSAGVNRGGEEGGQMASTGVKAHIRAILAAENPRKPHSDQRIVALLRGRNIKIARRTVAKYREALRVQSSVKRKRVG